MLKKKNNKNKDLILSKKGIFINPKINRMMLNDKTILKISNLRKSKNYS